MTYTDEIENGHPVSPHEIRSMHRKNRENIIQSLFAHNRYQLIDELLAEMDAKNEAYYFIIENGHMDAFGNYCKTERRIEL